MSVHQVEKHGLQHLDKESITATETTSLGSSQEGPVVDLLETEVRLYAQHALNRVFIVIVLPAKHAILQFSIPGLGKVWNFLRTTNLMSVQQNCAVALGYTRILKGKMVVFTWKMPGIVYVSGNLTYKISPISCNKKKSQSYFGCLRG